jgi:hypothetical protein
MKYSIHMAVILLLALSACTKKDDQISIRFPNTPVDQVFQFYRDLNPNTVLVLSSQCASMEKKTVNIIPDKPMGRSSLIRLVEDELDKQHGIKFRHVSLKKALALDTIDLGRKVTVLVVSLPPPPKQSSAGTSNEVRSIIFPSTTLTQIKKYYEGLSGTTVLNLGSGMQSLSIMYFKLEVRVPMTKDTALKILDIALAMQSHIKVSHDQPGQTVWLWSFDPPRKAKWFFWN